MLRAGAPGNSDADAPASRVQVTVQVTVPARPARGLRLAGGARGEGATARKLRADWFLAQG